MQGSTAIVWYFQTWFRSQTVAQTLKGRKQNFQCTKRWTAEAKKIIAWDVTPWLGFYNELQFYQNTYEKHDIYASLIYLIQKYHRGHCYLTNLISSFDNIQTIVYLKLNNGLEIGEVFIGKSATKVMLKSTYIRHHQKPKQAI